LSVSEFDALRTKLSKKKVSTASDIGQTLMKFENHAEVVRRGYEGAMPAIEKWLAEIGAA
jgi:hypothetical protein